LRAFREQDWPADRFGLFPGSCSLKGQTFGTGAFPHPGGDYIGLICLLLERLLFVSGVGDSAPI